MSGTFLDAIKQRAIIPYNVQCDMASGRKRPPCYTLDVHFASEQEKEAFTERLKAVRQLLTPAGSRPIDNCSLLNALFDAAEGAGAPQPTVGGSSSKSFMRNNGEYTNNNICSSTKLLLLNYCQTTLACI